jgi:transposase-like protein
LAPALSLSRDLPLSRNSRFLLSDFCYKKSGVLREADHGALKRLINPACGFKTTPTDSATIIGFEVMRMIRKRQCLMFASGGTGIVCLVNRLFRLAA